MELQRRISTLTAALSEKAEENLDLRAELEQQAGEKARFAAERRARDAEAELARVRQDREAQEELNQEFQRRISTLSVCLTELAEVNAAALAEKTREGEASRLARHNDSVLALGRQAALGLADSKDVVPLAMSGGGGGGSRSDRSEKREEEMLPPASPVTPQLVQDYQGEIERLKFRLRKRKAKMEKMREVVLQHKDRADSASKACAKYEKELKRLNREAEESLGKELAKRRELEQIVKVMTRKVNELEFLMEEKGGNVNE